MKLVIYAFSRLLRLQPLFPFYFHQSGIRKKGRNLPQPNFSRRQSAKGSRERFRSTTQSRSCNGSIHRVLTWTNQSVYDVLFMQFNVRRLETALMGLVSTQKECERVADQTRRNATPRTRRELVFGWRKGAILLKSTC